MASFASKFFQAGTSESESESEVEDNQIISKPTQPLFSESSDEEEVQRIVKSSVVKKHEEFSALVTKLRNSLKIQDYEAISVDINSLFNLNTKYDNEDIPGPALHFVVSLIDNLEEIWKDKDKKTKIGKVKVQAIGKLRQKLKKQEEVLGEKINNCRENPNAYELEFEDIQLAETSKTRQTTKKSKNSGGNVFMKIEKDVQVIQKRERKAKTPKQKVFTETKVHIKQPRELFSSEETITFDSFVSKMREVFRMRSKKSSDKNTLLSLETLKQIAETKSFGVVIQIKIQTLILTLQIDAFINDSVIKPERWRVLIDGAQELFNLLVLHPDIKLKDDISEEQESFSTSPFKIMGNPVHICLKLAEELKKIMQVADPYSLDYLQKMKEVTAFDSLVLLIQPYVEQSENVKQICDFYMLRVEQLYYRLEKRWLMSLGAQLTDFPTNVEELETDTLKDTIDFYCKYLYLNGRDRVPLKTSLYHVYFLAINNYFTQAKDLFLMSRAHEQIHLTESSIQSLYNRVLVQLGLCAFRHGNFKEAHSILKDIELSGRIRELLCQSLISRSEKSAKQESLDRKQLLPFHMHINIELTECVYLVSALVVEGAYSASPNQELRINFNSKGLTGLVRVFDRLVVQGSPESMRECVFAAFKALKIGNWKAALTFIRKIKCWRLLVNYTTVLNTLELQIKKECLVAFIFTNCSAYSRITLSFLQEEFQLSERDVKVTINRMIIRDSFPIRWNHDASVLIIQNDAIPTSISYLSSTILERIKIISEQQQRVNEVIISIKKFGNRLRR